MAYMKASTRCEVCKGITYAKLGGPHALVDSGDSASSSGSQAGKVSLDDASRSLPSRDASISPPATFPSDGSINTTTESLDGLQEALFQTLLRARAPKTYYTIGSYNYLEKSAQAGCDVCQNILQGLMQRATNTKYLDQLKAIKTVKIHLDEEDNLLVQCETEDGFLKFNDLEANIIKLHDLEDVTDLAHEKSQSLTSTGAEVKGKAPRSTHDNRMLIAKNWLMGCLQNHPKCTQKSGELPTLPTRVLDVGPIDQEAPLKSQLLMSNGRRSNYLTLSHCWGGSVHTLALSGGNLGKMLAGINDSQMPKTFRDAIMITRQLGQRYLWIDSLCIIQPMAGDNEDWRKEGVKMGDIYQNSLCTIAASSASNSAGGCLFGNPGSGTANRPCLLFPEPVERDVSGFKSMILNQKAVWSPVLIPSHPSWLNVVENAPLSQRAWVFQERILPPRILHCSLQGFFWECTKSRASEFEPHGCPKDWEYRDRGLLNITKLSQLDHQKLAIVAGVVWSNSLAQTIQNIVGDMYLFGHWQSSLLKSLLWFRVETPGTPLPIDKRTIAPSWSWASMPGEIKFTPLDTDDYPSRDLEKYVFKASIEEVSEDHLKIRGRLRIGGEEMPPIFLIRWTADEYWTGYLPGISKDLGQLGAIGRCDPDHPSPSANNTGNSSPRPSDRDSIHLIVDGEANPDFAGSPMCFLQILSSANNELALAEARHEGLVLIPVADEPFRGRFRRVGFFRSKMWELFDDDHMENAWTVI